MRKLFTKALLGLVLLLTTAARADLLVDPVFVPKVGCGGGGSTVLLMPFSGTNGSTGSPGMDDISPAAHGTASVNNSAQISTAQFKFSPSSLLTAPTDDFIFYTASADWGLSAANSDQFTIEYWIRYSSIVGNRVSISLKGVTDGLFGFVIQNNLASSDELDFAWSPTGLFAGIQVVTTSGAALTTGGFIPIAVTKDGTGTIRIFINGVIKASATPANSVIFNPGSPGVLSIGGTAAGGNAQDGWTDEVRIIKGFACYTANYTPSTIPFPP